MLTAFIDRLTGFLRPDQVRGATKNVPSERDRAPLVSPITIGLLEALGIRHALAVHDRGRHSARLRDRPPDRAGNRLTLRIPSRQRAFHMGGGRSKHSPPLPLQEVARHGPGIGG